MTTISYWWDSRCECMRPPPSPPGLWLPAPPPGRPWRTEFDVLLESQQRIEDKLDTLLLALIEDEAEPVDLDGNPIPRERDENQIL